MLVSRHPVKEMENTPMHSPGLRPHTRYNGSASSYLHRSCTWTHIPDSLTHSQMATMCSRSLRRCWRWIPAALKLRRDPLYDRQGQAG